MANINLLPWRDEYRLEKRNEFLVVAAGVVIFGVLTIFAWDRWVSGRIDNQSSRNALLEREIAVLDEQVKEIKELKLRRQQMLERMQVIQSLQSNRPELVKIFDEFVRSTPGGVYFVEMNRVAENMALVGFAESNNRISALMRQLDASSMFSEPNLTKVEANDELGEQGSRFELQVKVISQSQLDLARAQQDEEV